MENDSLSRYMSPQQEQQLILSAKEGVRNALTNNQKDSDIRFGASVLTTLGNIYASGQYYSDTASLTLHAEQAVLAHAASHGEYEITAIAIACNTYDTAYPCHMCKQLLWESYLRSKKDIEILIIENDTIRERFYLKKIMSYTWPQ